MKIGFKVLCVAGCFALLSLMCGFATDPSQSSGADVIATAAPVYEPLAALHGAERFPQGAQLIILHNGTATTLVPGFAATADANVAFDGSAILFSGKKSSADHWQIYELTLADRKIRQVVTSEADAIRPLYLPGWRLVYAQKSGDGFEIYSSRLVDTKALAEIEGKGMERPLPITFTREGAIPLDVIADGRVLFESGFPLGEGDSPELYLIYSDGSGVESYRCDHSSVARYGGHQLRSGDVVFTHGTSLARFTSPTAEEQRVGAPRAEYAGQIAETASGEWLLAARNSESEKFSLKIWKQGSPVVRAVFARAGENLIDPVFVAGRDRPRRHPSALHDWDYGNLLALDARVSRDERLKGTPARVRLEVQDAAGREVSLGTAPVEADGSFFVKAPADRPIRFALLDAEGKVLREEHGWFWIRRGEQRYCVGCHAGPEHAPENRVPAVLTRSTTPVDLSGARSQSAQGGGN